MLKKNRKGLNFCSECRMLVPADPSSTYFLQHWPWVWKALDMPPYFCPAQRESQFCCLAVYVELNAPAPCLWDRQLSCFPTTKKRLGHNTLTEHSLHSLQIIFFSRMQLGFLFLIDSLSSLEGLESSSLLLSHVARFPTRDPATSPSCLCLLPSPRDRMHYFEKIDLWEICSHNPLTAFPSPRDPNKAAPWNKHHSRLELCFLHPFPHRQYFGDLVNYIKGNLSFSLSTN